MIPITNTPPNRFLTVKQFPIYYEAFSESALRWLIFNEKTNGFCRCIRRIGRKILIDVVEFDRWISEQQGGVK